jgi:hypothetical protein
MNGTMKNTASKVVKRAGLLGLFLIGAFMVNAQSAETNPRWVVSKDVQKVANKKMYESENRNGTIQAKSLSSGWAISKGIHQSAVDKTTEKGNVASKGIPAWTISKGVHQTKNK